jgi:hypothetical protein
VDISSVSLCSPRRMGRKTQNRRGSLAPVVSRGRPQRAARAMARGPPLIDCQCNPVRPMGLGLTPPNSIGHRGTTRPKWPRSALSGIASCLVLHLGVKFCS